jgi:hypothetical protein
MEPVFFPDWHMLKLYAKPVPLDPRHLSLNDEERIFLVGQVENMVRSIPTLTGWLPRTPNPPRDISTTVPSPMMTSESSSPEYMRPNERGMRSPLRCSDLEMLRGRCVFWTGCSFITGSFPAVTGVVN